MTDTDLRAAVAELPEGTALTDRAMASPTRGVSLFSQH